MPNPSPQSESIQITLQLPAHHLTRIQPFTGRNAPFPSHNAFVTAALEHFLNQLEHQEINRQFEAMADDIDYQKLNEQLVEEFADSDWETLF